MKKTKRISKAARNKNDEKFAKKVISQTLICVLIFAIVLANSKLSNSVSTKINNNIKHYLCVSVDFNHVIKTTKAYFDNLMNKQQSIPVNMGELGTEEDKQ